MQLSLGIQLDLWVSFSLDFKSISNKNAIQMSSFIQGYTRPLSSYFEAVTWHSFCCIHHDFGLGYDPRSHRSRPARQSDDCQTIAVTPSLHCTTGEYMCVISRLTWGCIKRSGSKKNHLISAERLTLRSADRPRLKFGKFVSLFGCDIVQQVVTMSLTNTTCSLRSSAKDSKSRYCSIIPGLSCGTNFPFKEFSGLCGRCQSLSSADELEREKYIVCVLYDASILTTDWVSRTFPNAFIVAQLYSMRAVLQYIQSVLNASNTVNVHWIQVWLFYSTFIWS